MTVQRSTSAAGYVSLEVGQPFNPFRLFNGIFIPDALVRAKGISPGAKITYGRLSRYAGENGECYPAVPTLACEIGMSGRQTQRYLTELEKQQLIRRLARFLESGQTSNGFVFLWHPIFTRAAVTRMALEGVTDLTPEGVTESSPKESQSEESQIEEKTTSKRITGYASQKSRSAASERMSFSENLESQNRKADEDQGPTTDVRVGENDASGWTPGELASVRSRIVQYWGREPEQGFEVSAMLRARGASAAAVCALLDRKFENKKLRPGGKWAPKNQNWFLTMIENEFTPGHLPEPPAVPTSEQESLEAAILKRGIETIELPEAARSIVESVRCKECGGAALVQFTDGTIEGCGCPQKAPWRTARVTASRLPELHSSAQPGSSGK
jgi:hypothetical protein